MLIKLWSLFFIPFFQVTALQLTHMDKPFGWNSETSLSEIAFDYGVAEEGIQASKWIFNSAVTNQSTGVDLMAVAPGANQAFIEWTGKTTKAEWRTELKLKLDYDSATASGNCPMFGYVLHPGSMTINSDNTIPNFKGLAIWLQFCENGGGILGHFTDTNLASYDPYAYAFGLTCDSCGFGSSVPSTVILIIQVVEDRLQVAMKLPSMISTMCVNYFDITGFKSMITSIPVTVYMVGVNGNYGDLEVVSHEHTHLGADTLRCNV